MAIDALQFDVASEEISALLRNSQAKPGALLVPCSMIIYLPELLECVGTAVVVEP